MRRAKILLLAFALACPAMAAAADLAAEALEGAWLVNVGSDTRERFLILSGVHNERGALTVDKSLYGWIDGKGKPVREWRASVAGDAISIRYLTPADSLVQAKVRAGEPLVEGTMLTKGGKEHELRMTRLADEELAALRAAAKGEKRALSVTRDAKIWLLYVGAEDCLPCRRFEARVGSDGGGLKALAPEMAEAKFVKASLRSYRDVLSPGALPAELAWLAQAGANGKPPIRKRGTPFFAAVVDHAIAAQGHGVTALETLVVPEIQLAVQARRSAAR
jgi:hypothetical protein